MNRKEALMRMALFEKNHPVGEYVCFDWCVWPLLRVHRSGPETVRVSDAGTDECDKAKPRDKADRGISMKFSREELTSFMQEYEATHSVDEYVVNDWHVWPLLRLSLCMGWLPIEAPPPTMTAQNKAPSGTLTYLRKVANRIYGWLISQNNARALRYSVTSQDKIDPEHSDRHDSKSEVVLLTLSERRVMLNDALFEIYTDPLVEILQGMGVSTLVWEQGEPRVPRHSNSAWISRRLAAECSRIQPCAPGEAPRWFADYQTLSKKIIGRDVQWHEIKNQIDAVTTKSVVFEQWLRKVKPRLIIAVCWYDPLVMAATMAARRLRIKTVDLQHGVQDKGHYAYSCWDRSPKSGYETVPHFFWCWGENNAAALKQNNPAFAAHAKFLAGGNLWLNRWRFSRHMSAEQNEQREGMSFAKTILVTLQLDIEEFLFQAIKESLPSWRWLIRFHPARDSVKRQQEELKLRGLQHPGVELTQANHLLFYELLKDSDVHITGHSTCALEAIAFEVPSITFTESGRAAFRPLIEKGAILSAHSSDELLECIQTGRFNPAARAEIQKEFSGGDNARSSLAYLLNGERPIS